MAETISPDYLVIGAGAMGLAFVDELLISSPDKTFTIVDRYARPGGHWTMAYPYVRLHQPSNFYGVNSRKLGNDSVDQIGLNKGLTELAGKDEINAYYDTVMRQTFLPSGRVAYYPKHEYTGGREFKSILTGKIVRVGKDARIVDATYMKVQVPSMASPAYYVAKDAQLVSLNDLPSVTRPHRNYTVIGAGKTGIDAVLWLLTNDVDPARISWIMPRDSYFWARENFQPSSSSFAAQSRAMSSLMNKAVLEASSMEDLYQRWLDCGNLLQLDEKVKPSMWRCAIMSDAEFEELRKIKNVIRKGRVVKINKEEVELQNGTYKPDPDTLFVDCTANGLAKLPAVPVFAEGKITLQAVRLCQQVFSAAFIAHVEASCENLEEKNTMCNPIPHPTKPEDYTRILLQTNINAAHWYPRPQTAEWLKEARLDWGSAMMPPMPKDPEHAQKALVERKAQVEAVCANLQKFLTERTA